MFWIEETDKRFYIKSSTLPKAGYGCFANEDLEKGDWLEVIGIYVKKNGIADKCTEYAKRYKFAGGPKFNAHIIPMGYGGMVNHSDDPNLLNCLIEFVPGLKKRSPHAGQIVYRFIKPIYKDQELIGNYGEAYGKEIELISKFSQYSDSIKSEWDRFLQFDLYNLAKLFDGK